MERSQLVWTKLLRMARHARATLHPGRMLACAVCWEAPAIHSASKRLAIAAHRLHHRNSSACGLKTRRLVTVAPIVNGAGEIGICASTKAIYLIHVAKALSCECLPDALEQRPSCQLHFHNSTFG